jgi:cytidylate kinase
MFDKMKAPSPATVEQRIDAHLRVASRMKAETPPGTTRPAPFVTISRQYGCDAVALADAIAQKLAIIENVPSEQWQIYTRQIVESMAEEFTLSDRLLKALDFHARGAVEEFFEVLIGQSPPDLKLLHSLVRTVRAAAMHGYCIIVGRGGAILTRDLAGGIHVRAAAPPEWRLKNLIAHFGWEETLAKERLREAETGRRDFFQKYLGQDANDPAHYDLILNASRMCLDEQASAVAALFTKRFPPR